MPRQLEAEFLHSLGDRIRPLFGRASAIPQDRKTQYYSISEYILRIAKIHYVLDQAVEIDISPEVYYHRQQPDSCRYISPPAIAANRANRDRRK